MTCHQEANADSTGVPGAHDWHLAPLSMKWQDRDDRVLPSAEVSRTLTDRSKNGNLGGDGFRKHHSEDPIVRWAFEPGRRADGTLRALPPLTHEEFVTATKKWVDGDALGRPGRSSD